MAKPNGPKDATSNVLQLPPSHTNGSPKDGTPDQSAAPRGMIAVRTEYGPAYIDITQKIAFGPCVLQRQGCAPEHMMGRTTITSEVGTQVVNHDPATVAAIIKEAREVVARQWDERKINVLKTGCPSPFKQP